MYPSEYKSLKNKLANGDNINLIDLMDSLNAIVVEIESSRVNSRSVTNLEVARMDYGLARSIVEASIIHHGFIESDGIVYDSIDDCADILMDLDEVEKIELAGSIDDAWFQYIFLYDSHFGQHINNLMKQISIIKSAQHGDAPEPASLAR